VLKTANDYADAAPKLLLAHPWENDTDLTGWWMSEKLDGVRAWWTGTQFLSRLGNVYHAPEGLEKPAS
jgi:DNA ligase-1